MKNFYSLLVFAFIGFVGNAQIVNIPDANFKAKLLSASTTNQIAKNLSYQFVKIDSNNNGQIEVSEAMGISTLYINQASITSLEGILSFSNLKYLEFKQNQISSVNLNGLDLVSLSCDNNSFSSIDLSYLPNLQNFSCNNNQLTSLDISAVHSLYTLQCSYNSLTTLNTSNNLSLLTLSCDHNQLTSINLSGSTQLNSLNVSYNQLTSLNLTGLNLIYSLSCSWNLLTTLDVTPISALVYFYCDNNNLTTENFHVGPNPLLQNLYARNNHFTSLDLNSLTALVSLQLDGNDLHSLFIKNGSNEYPGLAQNPNLQFICADESDLSYLGGLAVIPSTCAINTYCNFNPGGIFYTIQGSEKLDINNNGCDASDSVIPNFKFSINGGTATGAFITSTSGNYFIPVNSGSYTITPVFENPTYYTCSPSSLSVSFPTQSSPYNQNFCIIPNGIHQDLDVLIYPIDGARAGFDAFYKILIKNKGNSTQSGQLNLQFDDSIIDYVTSNPAISSQSSNNLTWNYSNLLPMQTKTFSLTMNVNSPIETPAVNEGDILNYVVNVNGSASDEMPFDNTQYFNQVVANSHDPNSKTCIEGNTVSPSMIGQYAHYVIRFENTGTANAQNIVVTDLIDTTKFDISSLVPLDGSAPYITRISNTNKLEFIFENINLPFDDANNDGYVAFKIKTKPTLVVGNTFSNNAKIYFDYNSPITTNTATTTIAALSTQDFEFDTMFCLSPIPVKNMLTLTSKQNTIISSTNIYNSLGQLIQVNTNPTGTIDVSTLKTGSYFIKIISDKGTASSKFIKE